MAFPKPQQPQRAQETPTLPSVFAPLVAEEFGGMDTSTTRPGVKDEMLFWIDGYIPLSRQNLRTLPDVGDSILTVAEPLFISVFDFANIGANPYAIIFISDGSIYACNTNTGGPILIAPPGTIQNPSPTNVGVSQSGNQYILIVAKQTNGYFIWDGGTFFKPGDSFGGGNVPTAIGGNAIETYQGRVWIANGPTIIFSAPGSIIDFTTGSGGGNFTSTDSYLRVSYTSLVQTNGFLYLIADSSINYISGVQTSGSPPTTTFTNQNADPEVGTPYPGTVDVFGRNIIFANSWGAHISYGAAVTKISEQLDGIYNSIPQFAGMQISSAKATVFNKKIWMVLVPLIDPVTGQQRNKLLIWNGKIWFASEQGFALTYIQSQEINSVLIAWGTDGTNIRRLFQTPSNFTKRWVSKFWPTPVGYQTTKTSDRFWALAQYYDFSAPGVILTVQSENASADANYTMTPTTQNSTMTWFNNSGGVITWTNSLGQTIVWSAIAVGIVRFGPQAIAQKGALLGYTISTNCADMAWISAMIAPNDWGYDG